MIAHFQASPPERTYSPAIPPASVGSHTGLALETLPLARRCDLGGFLSETRVDAYPRNLFSGLGQPERSYLFGLTRILECLAASSSSPAAGAALAAAASEFESWSRRGVVPWLGSSAGARGNGRVWRSDSPRRDQVSHGIQFVGAAVPSSAGSDAGLRPPARLASVRVGPSWGTARRRFAAPTVHLQQRVTRSGKVASRCNLPRSQRRGA